MGIYNHIHQRLKKITPEKYHRFHHHPIINFSYFLVRKILGPIIRLVFIKEVTGMENIPKYGPALIAFNHQSFFDFICFIAVSPRNIHYLSAERFFESWLWRPIMHATGQIRVNRNCHDKNEMHDSVHEHLDSGKIIGIFPEGTRSPHKDEMLPAFSGVAKYAITKEAVVVPVGIKGTYEVMAKHDKKPNFLKAVSFHVGKPIDLAEHYGKKLSNEEYHDLTDKIMLEISALSGKRYAHVGHYKKENHEK